jgi:hypothetical protein
MSPIQIFDQSLDGIVIAERHWSWCDEISYLMNPCHHRHP